MHISPTGGAAGTGVSEAKLTPNTGQAAPAAETGGTPRTTEPAKPAILPDTAIIRELAVSDLLKLTQILQPPATPDRVERVEQLIEETVRAIQDDRPEWAVGRFIEAVTTDPGRVNELRSNPDLEAIRPNIELLLNRLTNVAKMDAETKLSAAEQVIESAGWQKVPHWETSPEALIQIGHRLLEAGGYVNYVRAADLANSLQSAYWSVSVEVPEITAAALKKGRLGVKRTSGSAAEAAVAFAYHSWDLVKQRIPSQIDVWWRRAPLLVILGTWFTMGLLGGGIALLAKTIWPDSWIVAASDFGFEVWGLGFLAIVGFGFWARVRKPKR